MSSLEGRLLQNIEAEIPRKIAALQFNQQLGMLTVEEYGMFSVAGFHRHVDPDATTIFVERALSQRPEEYRGLRHNAKGVGVMLGNTQEVVTWPNNQSRTCGLWLTQPLHSEHVRDLRSANPVAPKTKLLGIARHAMRIAQARLTDDERTVASIERPYGNASLVVMNPAPRWLLHQNNAPEPIPTWALVRDGMLTRIGVVTLTD